MKKLEINCGTCDATRLGEEALAGFEAVELNCGVLFVTPSSQRLLLDYGVELNAGSVISAPDGTEFVTKMGSCTIDCGDVCASPTFLVVMGRLTVAPGARKALDSFEGIQVMGSLLCRKSDRSAKIHIMGSETVYPDGYDYVEGDLNLDRLFRLRYGGKRLYTEGTVTVGDPGELDALAEAGTKILCGKLAAGEECLEKALRVAEPQESDGIVAIPEGFRYRSGNLTLTQRELRAGTKLYVDGNLTVERADAGVLEKLEGLRVMGRAVVPQEQEERLFALCPDCPDVLAYRGRLVRNEDTVKLTGARINREGFLTVLNCDRVELSEDLTDAEIETGLALIGCSEVRCSPEQEDAVRAVCRDVDEIMTAPPAPPAPEPADPDLTVVDCGIYRF